MEPEDESQTGICYECSTKDMDSSQRNVHCCDLCNKWFCEVHSEPRFPYFVDWGTMFDVQGDPRIKALFYSEYKRVGGHPCFGFLRKSIEALEIEKSVRDKLIQQAIDKMVNAEKLRTEIAIETMLEKVRQPRRMKTYKNKFGNRFSVPKDVYSNRTYREKLYNANTSDQVQDITIDYYRKYGKKKPPF